MKPSEKLEDLIITFDEMGYEPTTICHNIKEEIKSFKSQLKEIKTSLEEFERFTSLVINKNVFVNEVKALTLEQYNRDRFNNRLSKEEYTFIKELIKKYGK